MVDVRGEHAALCFCHRPKRAVDVYMHDRVYICVVRLDAFQILADPTRRHIVETLRDGEQQVGELVEKAGVHQSGVSRHLRILFESGFVAIRPDGQRRLYSLKPEPFQQLDKWLGQYEKLWAARLDRFETALTKKQQQARRADNRSKRK